MDEKTLLWLASGFRTVAAWRDAMFAHGYSMPAQLCHGLSGAMKRLSLKFPEAFRLLWDKKKIAVSGRTLLYDPSAADLWDARGQLSATRLVGPALPAIGWDRDVLALVPPIEEIVHLESLWCLAPGSSPLMKLALWRPTDEFDQMMREVLHEFGDDVLAATWKSADRQEGNRENSAYARLKDFAFKDEVTGLYNRRFFSIRLEEEVSRHRRLKHPVSVVLIDLDGFKSVNDNLGYPVGDETLRGVAEILMRHSRGINVICRYGGDRFAALLVETSKAGARLYADRIRYVLSSSKFVHKHRMTASFGIASLPEDVAPTAENLILAADGALSVAKRDGKNRVAVTEDRTKPDPLRE
jgi:diguanylate cyclase (GGDEF)-like protein